MAPKVVNRPVYLDYAAATPVDPRVIEEMVNCLKIEGNFANSASRDHVYGWEALDKVENARSKVADLVGASPLEIYFTSGATESSNLAILGLAKGLFKKGDLRRHLITTKIEHKAVLESCRVLESEGYKVTYLDTLPDGSVTPELLEKALSEDTFLVSIAEANSVVGTVNDIHALANLCQKREIYFHSDCAQSAGYFTHDLSHSAISLVSLTPEKICGPKGVGALFVNKEQDIPLSPLIVGGGQERGLRSGTVATHQVVGMGKAFEIMQKEGQSDFQRINGLREYLKNELSALDGVVINGSATHHLPSVLSVTFKGVEAHVLLSSLRTVAASTGSACNSKSLEPSYILLALGVNADDAKSTVRFSLGRFTTLEELQKVVAEIKEKLPLLHKK